MTVKVKQSTRGNTLGVNTRFVSQQFCTGKYRAGGVNRMHISLSREKFSLIRQSYFTASFKSYYCSIQNLKHLGFPLSDTFS